MSDCDKILFVHIVQCFARLDRQKRFCLTLMISCLFPLTTLFLFFSFFFFSPLSLLYFIAYFWILCSYFYVRAGGQLGYVPEGSQQEQEEEAGTKEEARGEDGLRKGVPEESAWVEAELPQGFELSS